TMIKGLPEKLKALRTKHGYSQKQIADRLNISPSIVSGYETGERTPSTDVLLELSYLLNCSTDYLLGKQQIEPSILIDANGLTDKQAQAVRLLIESIKNK
ncbi:MAG: helix-turn-helix transcriptional regulator, partial [Ruminococcus sp.]|nr:helix-turn-helix transcriptional regulator [Ruminococcus sp.]